MADKTELLLPTGRLIWGDAYVPETKDMQGNPLMTKTGPNAGKPRQSWTVGIAIPKGDEAQHGEFGWAHTPWGAKILEVGQKAFPGGAWQRGDFAWKIIDGDSTKFNQGKVPKRFCDIPNYKGNWIVKMASGFAPKIVNENGSAELSEPGVVYAGCCVQAYGNVEGNNNDTKPGLYINLQIVSFQGHHKDGRITSGPDAAVVGFGGAPMVGQTAMPPGGMSLPQAQVTSGLPGVPGLPGLPGPQATGAQLPGLPGLPGAAAGIQIPATLPVLPNNSFVSLPGVPTPNVPMAIPAPAAARLMTAKAGGATRDQFHANGWTDDMLLRDGYMI